VVLATLIALGIPLALSVRERVNDEVRSQAHSQAAIVATGATPLMSGEPSATLERLARIAGRTVRGRVIIVDRRGRLIADSEGDSRVGVGYLSRPEIFRALKGRGVQVERTSRTLGEPILATSDPIIRGDQVIGAVRITQSVEDVRVAIRSSLTGLGALALLVLAFALVLAVILANRISRPIARLERSARGFASGRTEAPAPIEGTAEQRSLSRSFNAMTVRVTRLLRSQRDFVADASHQLRTPLTGLRLRLEGLRDDVSADIELVQEVDAGMAEVDRLSKMVDELLLLSRAGELDTPGEVLDIAELVNESGDRWSATAAERGISLSVVDRAAGKGVFCARADLERVIDVLVENAINYSGQGSEVSIEGGPDSIVVADRGEGLEEGEEEKVFERFVRGSAGRTGVKGTGLGLPIARSLMLPWDAEVTLVRRPGGGSLARISFPDSALRDSLTER
jgi:signal transduction histidine kinase